MRGAIFDLDGTLADTAADLLSAANVALASEGLPLLTLDEDRRVAGRGGRAMIRQSLARAGRNVDGEAEIALTDHLYPVLLEAYAGCLADETSLYAGVEACLDNLAEDGWKLGICTNKPEGLARRLMEELGILDRFGALLGADTLRVRKPDPTHLLETCNRIGADPRASIMIGDTVTDLHAARNAGMPCILTAFGFSLEPIEELAPDAIFETYAELPSLLGQLSGTGAKAAS